MDWEDYKGRFIADALEQAKSEQFIAECLVYAEQLVRAGLPVIYDYEHLAGLLGFEAAALKSALSDVGALYHEFRIPKRRYGYRQISSPRASLWQIQRWILVHVLNRCACHAVATAFVRNRSIKHNALVHEGQKIVLSLDVKDFFTSIAADRVKGVYRGLGYSDEVVETLTLLTTLHNGLPQGAPTSPSLSNLVMQGVDAFLHSYSLIKKIHYTRYADDLTFSGDFHAGDVIKVVRAILGENGLALNEGKTRRMLPHQRQEVTGVVVNRKMQAPRELRRSLRLEVYHIKRWGLDEHVRARYSLYTRRLEHLRGIAEFILFLNPNDRDARDAIEVLGRVRYERIIDHE